MSVMAVGARMRLRAPSRLRGSVAVLVSTVVLAVVVMAALLAPLLATNDPSATDLSAILVPPGTPGHLLGTDPSGRDIAARLLYGARISLLAPLAVVTVATVAGTSIGLLAGWCGGLVDAVVSRVLDFMFAFPGLLLAIFAVTLFGTGLLAPMVALMIAYAPFTARLVRNLVMAEKQRPHVDSYRLQGYSGAAIATGPVLANIAPTLLSQSVLGFGYTMIDLAVLSFLGYGVQPPTADWGSMVKDAQEAILQGAFSAALIPCLTIVVTVVAFTVVGDAVGERLGRKGDR